MNDFTKGMLVMGALTAALFFVHFWRKSSDRLFLYFAGCFLLLALNWFLLVVFSGPEERPMLFALRIVAFGLLITGILDKNWRRK
ncbi:MAG TPA: DUF5985 family protein [Phycisphaerales bacterium]|nr:DUF5985 family protein [Phycisphaerales bacterium]